VVFAVIGIGLVALRNSSYGRRLTAMKDSPAASATLGQSLLRLKLSVFMLSAAIAGLGGVLMSMALGAVTPDNFSIFLSLSLLMLTVVAGIAYVSGALVGGLLAGVGFALIVTTFHNLAARHGSVHGLFAFLASFAAVSPALIGIGVGRNPSGSVHQFIDSYRTLRDRKAVLAGGAALEVLLYVLTLTGVLGRWWFAILTVVLVMLLPLVGRMSDPELVRQRAAETPLEFAGIDSPYTDGLRAELDRALGIEELVRVPAPSPVPRPVRNGSTAVTSMVDGAQPAQSLSSGSADAGA
jgi:hypothetical protein